VALSYYVVHHDTLTPETPGPTRADPATVPLTANLVLERLLGSAPISYVPTLATRADWGRRGGDEGSVLCAKCRVVSELLTLTQRACRQ
jgi:hypothetical protein